MWLDDAIGTIRPDGAGDRALARGMHIPRDAMEIDIEEAYAWQNDKLNGINRQKLQTAKTQLASDAELGRCTFRVSNRWLRGTRNVSRVHGYHDGTRERQHGKPFGIESDQPPLVAGSDAAVSPMEQLLAALASCVTSTVVLRAAIAGIRIDEVEAEVQGQLDLTPLTKEAPPATLGYENIQVRLRVSAAADPAKIERLAASSPTLLTISNGAPVRLHVEAKRAWSGHQVDCRDESNT